MYEFLFGDSTTGEAIFTGIVLVVLSPLLVALALFFYYTGWAFIFYAASSPVVQISIDDDFAGAAAYVSLWIYTIVLIAYVIVGFFVKDGSGLPATLQLIASFLKFPDAEQTKVAAAGGTIDVKSMAEHSELRHSKKGWEPNWVKKARAMQYDQAAKNLKVESDVLEAEAAMHKASREYNQAKVKAEALRKKK